MSSPSPSRSIPSQTTTASSLASAPLPLRHFLVFWLLEEYSHFAESSLRSPFSLQNPLNGLESLLVGIPKSGPESSYRILFGLVRDQYFADLADQDCHTLRKWRESSCSKLPPKYNLSPLHHLGPRSVRHSPSVSQKTKCLYAAQ